MKKLISMGMAAMLVVLLAGCSSNEAGQENAPGDESSAGELDMEKLMEDFGDVEAFSKDGALRFLKVAGGLDEAAIAPDWEYVVDDASMRNYGDDPTSGYGHGAICFQKAEGELTTAEYEAWAQKVFDATAAASDDGFNVVGYEFAGDGEDPLSQASLSDALGSWMPGWCYLKDGTYMAVYINKVSDSSKESQIGEMSYIFGASVDVGVGLQKSWDDTMAEAEKYMEENEEEIREALDEYLK